ncbi:hypothetical protein QWZ10_19055 [Paracoccus cavernae]|uniref:Uncharacterized protein n=1 Tax=Paracoccus cavernae TaxID=1571207 RepID=A0ABT8D9Z3_9RHOB|nr:hypothetical protein [Paracoccus cavernae]
MLDAGNGLRCPCCSGGTADLAALDTMIWDLIQWRGLSENAESVLRAAWAGAGRPVTAAAIFDEIYRFDIDGGPTLAAMYAALRAAIAELTEKLDGTGISVIRQGQRDGWRVVMSPGDGAFVEVRHLIV